MPEHVLAIDAGSTSIRAVIVGPTGTVSAQAKAVFPISFPAPGLVEQDPDILWGTVNSLTDQALREAGIKRDDLAAMGITTQRSCCVIWERATAKAVSPIVSWQDLRGIARAEELMAQGYLAQPQSAAAKLEAVLDAVPNGRARMASGELAWGNIDSFLVACATGGAAHLTDPSQACATSYYDVFNGRWDESLLAAQDLPQEFFPEIVDTWGQLAQTSAATFGATIPITAIVADQQSAAIAQQCFEPGQAKMTYGTSGTCDVVSGTEILIAPGTYPLVMYRHGDEAPFCIEGMVITAGATFDWLSGGLGIMTGPEEAAGLAGSVPDTNGVYVLPALQGLGSPHFDPARQGIIGGLTRGATKAHVVRAAMEGVAFRTREMLDVIYDSTNLPRPDTLRVDGGAAANDLLLQIQSDILGMPIERMSPLEATSFGAAILAGQGVGLWSADDVAAFRKTDRTFQPTGSEDERASRYAWWKSACGL